MQGQPDREVSGGEAGGRRLTIYTPDSYKAPVIGSIVNCVPGTWEQHSRHLGTGFPTPGNNIPIGPDTAPAVCKDSGNRLSQGFKPTHTIETTNT